MFIAKNRKIGDTLENLAGDTYLHRHTPQNWGLAPSFTPRQPREPRIALTGKLGACPQFLPVDNIHRHHAVHTNPRASASGI